MCEEIKMKKCKRCERELPANNVYFFTNNNLKDGLESKCKECEGYKFQDYKNKNVSNIEGYKKCTKCKRDLPLNSDYFNKDKNLKGGFVNICKECKGDKFTYKNCKEGYQVCIKCLQELPLTNEYYYTDNANKTGYFTICKDCITGKNLDSFNIEDWYNNKGEVFKSNWSLEDINWLYNNYTNVSKQDLLNRFYNKKYKTITNVVYQWNIKKFEKMDIWSDEDMEFLIQNYPNMPQEDLEKRFTNRTWISIKGKASKLGIGRDDETLIKINSKSHIGYVFPEERKREISRNRRREKSGGWKGGLTPLITYFRAILYEWKLDSLKKYNYKCALTNTNDKDLEIHHAKENFSDIVYETLNKLNLPIYENMMQYSDDELKNINKLFIELHNQYGLGIPLKKNIHKLFHTIYGLTNNTEEQFVEFKNKFFNGDFEEALKITDEDIRLKKRKRKSFRRLKAEEVREIRKLINKGFPTEYIAKQFGVRNCAIYNIKVNKSWKNVS